MALSINPNCAKAVHNIGVIEFQTGNLIKSTELFSKALELDTNLVVAYRNRALVLFEQQNYEDALSDLVIYTAIKPFDINALRLTGMCYEQLNNYFRALDTYLLAKKIARFDFNIILDLVNIYRDNNKHLKALALLLMQAYRIRHLSIIFGRAGDILNDLCYYTAAIIFYTLALMVSRKKYYLYFSRSTALYSKGKLDLSQKDLLRVIKSEPRFADAHFNLGNVYMRKRQYSHAIDSYTKGITLSPNSPNYYFNRAQAHFFLENYIETINDAQRYIALAGETNELILKLTGISFLKQGNIAIAVKYLEKVLSLSPTDKNKAILKQAYFSYLNLLSETNSPVEETKLIYDRLNKLSI